MRSGRLGAGGPNGRPCGSDPPENGPRLHIRAFRGGRSRDFSLQEGRSPRGRRKVSRGRPDRHSFFSESAIQTSFQAHMFSASGFTEANVNWHPRTFSWPRSGGGSPLNQAFGICGMTFAG